MLVPKRAETCVWRSRCLLPPSLVWTGLIWSSNCEELTQKWNIKWSSSASFRMTIKNRFFFKGSDNMFWYFYLKKKICAHAEYLGMFSYEVKKVSHLLYNSCSVIPKNAESVSSFITRSNHNFTQVIMFERAAPLFASPCGDWNFCAHDKVLFRAAGLQLQLKSAVTPWL